MNVNGDCIVCTEEQVALVKSCEHEALVCQTCLDKVSSCPVCRARARAPRKRSRIEAALDDEEAALELRLSMSTEQIEHWETNLQQLIDAQEQARSALQERERLIERLLDRIEHQEAERIDLRAQLQTLRQQRLQQQ